MLSPAGRPSTTFCRRCTGAAALAVSLSGSAALMSVALSSSRYWWLGCVTLIPLFLAIRVLSPAMASLAGAHWGASLFVACATLGAAPFAEPLQSLGLLVIVPALYAAAASVVTRRNGFHPLLLALGWAGVEFALKPLALHHGLLAGTQGDGWFVRAAGQMGGYVFVAFLLAGVNAVLLSVLSGVRVSAPRPLVLKAAIDSGMRLIFRDFVLLVRHFIRPSQPRAPPLDATL